MATRGGSPTIRRRELASRLRRLRTESGKSLKEVAEYLMCSESQLSRLETGKRIATPRDLRDLCDLYGVQDQAVRDELLRLSREARERSWWRQYNDLGDVELLIDYQAGASSITEYDSCLVPGLLQTEAYARAAIRGFLPEIRSDVLAERVEARMRRQRLLEAPDAPTLRALLDESVLLRHVGGVAVMKEQLEKLLLWARRAPKVTIQVVPFTVGAHPGVNSAFSLVEFTEAGLTPIVYSESLAGEFYLEAKSDIDRHLEAVAHLSAVALEPSDSANYITKTIDHL